MSSADPTFEDALQDLSDFLRAIEEYLGSVVLCGGWVPYFYRHLPELSVPDHGPLLTFDFDLVSPPRLPLAKAGSLHDQLVKGGFVAIHNQEPPVVYYQHARWEPNERAPVYGELLTPLEGSEVSSTGEPKILSQIQEGVVAQQLRYLQLLLHDPLTVQAVQVPMLGLPERFAIRVPNPAAFILQKALALNQRRPEKQRKDLAYVFEVAALWFYETERVSGMADSIAEGPYPWSKWVERGRKVLIREFDSESADGAVSAEQVFGATADGHLVNATAVARLTRSFLGAVFPGS